MKRDIKFRAWDGEKMIYPTDEHINANWTFDRGYLTCECLTCHEALFDDKYIKFYPIMQFTGLHDALDMEIWEGDIVSYEDHEWEVVFWYDRWDMVNRDKSVRDDDIPDDPGFTKWDFCRVIGNIYENPELIEDN